MRPRAWPSRFASFRVCLVPRPVQNIGRYLGRFQYLRIDLYLVPRFPRYKKIFVFRSWEQLRNHFGAWVSWWLDLYTAPQQVKRTKKITNQVRRENGKKIGQSYSSMMVIVCTHDGRIILVQSDDDEKERREERGRSLLNK